MLLKPKSRRVHGRYECKCCDGSLRTSKGVKSLRRRLRTAEKRNWKREVA